MGFFKKAGSRKRSADVLTIADDTSSSPPVHQACHREEQQRSYYLQRVAKKLGFIQFLEKHLSEEEVMDLAHEQARQQAMGPPSQRPNIVTPLSTGTASTARKRKRPMPGGWRWIARQRSS
jgi:hypothetical protein